MKATLCLCGVVALALVGCGEKASNSNPTAGTANPATNAYSGNPITAPVDYLGAVAAGKTFAEKTIDLAQLKHALQMYQVDKGHYPQTLDELVQEKLLHDVPKAPYGMKLEYDPATGQVKIVKAQ